MDTITHTLFGLTLYGAVNKTSMTVREKRALLVTAITGSQIPDIDVISSLWDTAGQYQMWHRGITHSLFMAPVWAALIAALVRLLFRVRGRIWFTVGLIAVLIHDTSDLFNAWGTGFFEPVSSVRLTFGTVPIVDLVFWTLMAGGFLIVRFGRGRMGEWPSHRVFQGVWALMALHVMLQTLQGGILLNSVKTEYEQAVLSADFIPGVFTVIGKEGDAVELRRGSLWKGMDTVANLSSQESADLELLFATNPKAKTLYEWSPFVVIVDDGQRLGIYDPRFYRNGESFLYEYMDRVP